MFLSFRYLSEGFQVIIEKSKDAKCSLKDIQLRFLCPDDLEEVCIAIIHDQNNI